VRTQPLGPLPPFLSLCARALTCVRERSFAINFMVTADWLAYCVSPLFLCYLGTM
jgi:hypothetical protein